MLNDPKGHCAGAISALVAVLIVDLSLIVISFHKGNPLIKYSKTQ